MPAAERHLVGGDALQQIGVLLPLRVVPRPVQRVKENGPAATGGPDGPTTAGGRRLDAHTPHSSFGLASLGLLL